MLRIKKTIQDKLEEVTNEYNVILSNHSQDFEYGLDNMSKLKSYKYLYELGKVDGDEYWGYGSTMNIVLNAKEFKKFIELYDEDLFNNPVYRQIEKNEFINMPEIQKLLKSKDDKLLNWN